MEMKNFVIAAMFNNNELTNFVKSVVKPLVKDEILAWSADEINAFMHKFEFWPKTTKFMDYSRENVGKLVEVGIDNNLSVSLEIEKLKDYYLYSEKDSNNYYVIVGCGDEQEEIEEILELDDVVDKILSKQQMLMNFIEFLIERQKAEF